MMCTVVRKLGKEFEPAVYSVGVNFVHRGVPSRARLAPDRAFPAEPGVTQRERPARGASIEPLMVELHVRNDVEVVTQCEVLVDGGDPCRMAPRFLRWS